MRATSALALLLFGSACGSDVGVQRLDAAAADSTTARDSGTTGDSGTTRDSAVATDSATGIDAGTGTDAGAGSDAGHAPDDLSADLMPIRDRAHLPALAAAVWRDDTLLAEGAVGVRRLGDDTPVTTADQWHLGSDTKAMTATLIGLYVDRGVIGLDDTIGALFEGETVDPRYADVTIEQLLEHRGGAPGDIPSAIWDQMWADGAAPDARIRAVRALIALAPAQAPGTFVYANAGYMIAGAALERITGRTWESMIQSELFAPLGMASCAFGAPGTPGVTDEPWGHSSAGGVLTPLSPGPMADNPPSIGPAGTVHCSLSDWGKFLVVPLRAARGEPTLVSAPTMERLLTPPAGGDYACGWGVTSRDWAGGLALTHSGSNTLWYATAWLAPGMDLIYAVATNAGDDGAAAAVDTAFGPLIETYGMP